MILPVLTIQNPKLRKKAGSVSKETLALAATQAFIDDLIMTMLEKDGLGLAATQVGSELSMFAVATEHGNEIFVNPTIIKHSWKKAIDEEGCLSVPKVYGLVKRSESVVLRAMDRTGQELMIKAKGLLARVFQHEIDHLHGVLFIDHVKTITKGQAELDSLLGKNHAH